MVSRSQVDRIAARIEALAANATRRLVVVDPSETPAQALHRQGFPQAGDYLFICTGVPRLSAQRRHGDQSAN
jgi:hypothetical protein